MAIRRRRSDVSRPRVTPVGALIHGLAAGTLATAAMDGLPFLRYRRGGGTTRCAPWEFSSGLSSWEDAPAPAQAGRRLFEGLFQVQLAPEWVPLVDNLTHWGFGVLGGI
jgi:hypothetical protein